MSSPSSPTDATADAWSVRIAHRFHLTLNDELVQWFDDEIWRFTGGGEYRDPVEPEALLEDAPEVIWPGLMPPDFLPLVSNGAGDWLCLKLISNQPTLMRAPGRASNTYEIVQWYHGGGDWIPWGNSLAEAIVFDAVCLLLPGAPRRHAIPAEPTRPVEPGRVDPLLQWALSRMPQSIAAQTRDLVRVCSSSQSNDGDAKASQLAEEMLDQGIAEIPLRSELVQRLLSDARLNQLDRAPNALQRLGISRHDWNRWLFDVDTIPSSRHAEFFGPGPRPQQDWSQVAEHCRRVIEIAPQLAWPWDLLGYSLQRAGEFDQAAQIYAQGVLRSVFTDQSIRLRTHGTMERAAKFSAEMLLQMLDDLRIDRDRVAELVELPYLEVLMDPENSGQVRATAYWLARADRSSAIGDYQQAVEEIYAAGWDLGAATLPAYGAVLDRLAATAEIAKDAARAELARTHRRCLSDRFGI